MDFIHGFLFFELYTIKDKRKLEKKNWGGNCFRTPVQKNLCAHSLVTVLRGSFAYSFALFRTMSFSWLISCAL